MSEQTIQPGKFVSLTYAIVEDGGDILEQNDVPVNYIYGGDQELIGGMDSAVKGKKAGDVVELLVSPDDGFGQHDPSLTFTDDLHNVPAEFHKLGAEVQMQNESGDLKSFYVTKIADGKLTVDGNHPLAGKMLRVRVVVQEVRDATPNDYPQGSGDYTIN